MLSECANYLRHKISTMSRDPVINSTTSNYGINFKSVLRTCNFIFYEINASLIYNNNGIVFYGSLLDIFS